MAEDENEKMKMMTGKVAIVESRCRSPSIVDRSNRQGEVVTVMDGRRRKGEVVTVVDRSNLTVMSFNRWHHHILTILRHSRLVGVEVGVAEGRRCLLVPSCSLVPSASSSALSSTYEKMEVSGKDNMVEPDRFTIASVISACAHLGSTDHGKWLHNNLRRTGLECHVVIGTALVNMYGKCGHADQAVEIFKEMPEKDSSSWTAMISVLALHGLG